MKRLFILAVLLLLTFFSTLSQEFKGKYTTISYTQFFDKIATETDSVFRLSDHVIEYDPTTDSLFSSKFSRDLTYSSARKEKLIIDKSIVLENVQFLSTLEEASSLEAAILGTINGIIFRRDFSLTSCIDLTIHDSEFLGNTTISRGINAPLVLKYFKNRFTNNFERSGFRIIQSKFYQNTTFRLFGLEKKDGLDADLYIEDNTFLSEQTSNNEPNNILVYGNELIFFDFVDNKFEGKSNVSILDYNNSIKNFKSNDFGQSLVEFDIRDDKTAKSHEFYDNIFQGIISIALDGLNPNTVIDFDQFNSQMISKDGFGAFRSDILMNSLSGNKDLDLDSLKEEYLNGVRASQSRYFDEEISLRGLFYNHYKTNFNTRKANAVYVEMKRIEGERLQFEYETDPTFQTYFSLQINLFLKVFSDYGTQPAKAIIFSVYVILAFALFYLFFPNYWDSHGKNRIMDRYRFFLKYVNKDSGMHEVYLDEKKPELLASEDFRAYLQEQGKTAPKFFMATALPLYRWSIAGTRTFSWMLSKVDVLKGKWSDTEDSKRGLKSVLLIFAFLISLTYDIFIKMLNALMLSINTFTTLGFGEIPIKGLPRYLAIIQGFIGWFMLTIFSVSLISQLLN